MPRDEIERNRGRFGDPVDTWPAPFRQQAVAFLDERTDAGNEPDAALDRLVFEAALVEGDDHALARTVLARIDAGSTRSSFVRSFILTPTRLAACAAAVVLAATAGGYQTALLQDDLADAELIALASGAQFADMDGGVAAELAGEDPL